MSQTVSSTEQEAAGRHNAGATDAGLLSVSL